MVYLRDPIPLPDNPALVDLCDWFYHRWQVQAECRCGRVAVVHRGELLRQYGEKARFPPERLAVLARRLKCIRCGVKGAATLTIVVEPKG